MDIVSADLLPAALTSTNLIVSSTLMLWSGCLRRSSWISASARPTQSWSATRSSPWLEMRSQPGHFFVKRQTSACSRSLAANARIGSPRSCAIRESATLATFGFSSLTASDLMAAKRSTSVDSAIGRGPMEFLVTSRRSLESQHSSSCTGISASVSCTAWTYDLHR